MQLILARIIKPIFLFCFCFFLHRAVIEWKRVGKKHHPQYKKNIYSTKLLKSFFGCGICDVRGANIR